MLFFNSDVEYLEMVITTTRERGVFSWLSRTYYPRERIFLVAIYHKPVLFQMQLTNPLQQVVYHNCISRVCSMGSVIASILVKKGTERIRPWMLNPATCSSCICACTHMCVRVRLRERVSEAALIWNSQQIRHWQKSFYYHRFTYPFYNVTQRLNNARQSSNGIV